MVEHVERLAWRYDLFTPGAQVRLDHFNQVTPDVPKGLEYLGGIGFRVTEDIEDEDGRLPSTISGTQQRRWRSRLERT